MWFKGRGFVYRLWNQKDSNLKVEFCHLVIADVSDLTLGPDFHISNKYTVIQQVKTYCEG